MRKIICIAASLLFILPHTAFAANGIGNYYYSDIKTYFFGAPITSYNLGGKTAIVCEDLNWHYNHDVYWFADERKLTVDKKDDVDFASLQAQAGETLTTQKGTVGAVAGEVYASDIKTYLNGSFIESYNIGGQTVIICEDMRGYGYDVAWNEAERSLYITGNESNFKRTADIGAVTELTYGSGLYGTDLLTSTALTLDGRRVEGAPEYCINSSYSPTRWFPLAPALDALGTQWEWDSSNNIFNVTSVDLNKIKLTDESVEEDKILAEAGQDFITIKLVLYRDGKEIPMTQTVIVGHMQNMHEETQELNAVLYDGAVYVPLSTIADCLGLGIDGESGGLVTSSSELQKSEV